MPSEATPAPDTSPAESAPIPALDASTRTITAGRTTRVSVELACLLCSRELGVLECDAWPTYGAMLLRRTGSPSVLVADWRRLRCGVCGGAAVLDEITSRPVRTEAPIDWAAERPRRGRPPKSLVDRRDALPVAN